MPSVSYGNTLTDLGRNIAEQKASERALAGILAQVGAQKLAALNALAANRGRTQAERDVGMDRNATTRQVAVMESMLRAQELGDRDRQSREGLAAAEAIARLQGANNLDVGRLPYSPEALKQLEALARLNAQTLNPRMQETIFAEDAERERQNLRAQSLSMDANRKASLLYQDWITKKAARRWWKPDDSDEELNAAYQTGINGILSSYGERDAGLVQSMTRPDGRVIFQPMQLPMTRRVPQVPVPPVTGDAAAIPPPNMVVPVPQASAAPATGPMAVPQTGLPLPTGTANALPTMAVPRAQPSILSAAQEIASGAMEQLPFNVRPGFPGESRGVFTEEQADQWLRGYVATLTDTLQGLSGRGGFGKGKSDQVRQELARVKAILSSR